MVNLAITIFASADPQSDDLYTKSFFTNQEIYDKLQQCLPQLQSVHAKQKIFNWIGQLFGKQRSQRVNNVQRRGRHLWILKDEAISKLSVCCPYYFNVVLKVFLFFKIICSKRIPILVHMKRKESRV
jgi:hypothetical protein